MDNKNIQIRRILTTSAIILEEDAKMTATNIETLHKMEGFSVHQKLSMPSLSVVRQHKEHGRTLSM